jgi:hypothetical protein
VCDLQFIFSYLIALLQEISAARKLVYSPEVREAGIHYLEHESLELMTPNGKKWKIYGSPVGPTRPRFCWS